MTFQYLKYNGLQPSIAINLKEFFFFKKIFRKGVTLTENLLLQLKFANSENYAIFLLYAHIYQILFYVINYQHTIN